MKKIIATLLWVFGICMAASDSSLWINILGLPAFLFGSALLLSDCKLQSRYKNTHKVHKVMPGKARKVF